MTEKPKLSECVSPHDGPKPLYPIENANIEHAIDCMIFVKSQLQNISRKNLSYLSYHAPLIGAYYTRINLNVTFFHLPSAYKYQS